MVEVLGKPFLTYQIEQLRDQGFSKILLLLGYLPEVVQDYFGDGSRFGVKIEYSISAVEDLFSPALLRQLLAYANQKHVATLCRFGRAGDDYRLHQQRWIYPEQRARRFRWIGGGL